MLDANVLVKAILSKKSRGYAIVRALLRSSFKGYVTDEIMVEYRQAVFSRAVWPLLENHGTTREQVERFLREIGLTLESVVPFVIAWRCEDPDDQKYIRCALAAHAQYIVSDDNHLLSLGECADTKVVSSQDFLDLLPEELAT